MSKSEQIIQKCKEAGIRYWAGDNISEVLEENPYQIDALYLAGLTAFQNNRNDIAKKVWSTVFEINPETKYKNSINENLLKMK